MFEYARAKNEGQRMRRAVIGLVALICWLASSAVAAKEPTRIALLIGNQNYLPEIGSLVNPINDINLMDATLTKIGFKVWRVENATLGKIHTALSAHVRRVRQAGPGAISFFYYSGHGAQDPVTSTNYLIPVDVTSALDTDLWDRSLRLAVVTRQLKEQAGNATHFVVFDACRNDLKLKKAGAKAIVQSKGFMPVPKVTGMLVAYATADGETASDIGQGAGPYARALAEEMTRPGVEAVTMFRNVQVKLYETSGQEPWLDFGYLSRVYFAGKHKNQNTSARADSAARQAWAIVKDSTDIAVLEAFAKHYKKTFFAVLAQERLKALRQEHASLNKPGPTFAKPNQSSRCTVIGRTPPRLKLTEGMKFCDAEGKNTAQVEKIANRVVVFLDNGKRKPCPQGELCGFDWPRLHPFFRITARADAAKGIRPEASMLPR